MLEELVVPIALRRRREETSIVLLPIGTYLMAIIIRVAGILPRFNETLVGTCRVDLGTESKGRVGCFSAEGNLLDVLDHEVLVPQTALVQTAVRMTRVDGPKGSVVVVDAMVYAGYAFG